MNASELYQAGQLHEAVAAAISDVKANATDVALRYRLAELLCFAGDFDRADKQLDTLTQQSTEAAMTVSVFRNLIRAETARQAFYSEGALPEFVAEVTPGLRLHLDASIAAREGEQTQAAELLAKAEEMRPKVAGVCNGDSFDDFRDLNDMTAGFLEVLTSTAKYYWVPFERIESIEFSAPERMMDLVWRKTQIAVNGGPEGEVYVPAIYAGTAATDDAQLMLGRGTDWSGEETGAVLGTGLRMFLVGESDKTLMQIKQLSFSIQD